MVSPGKKRSGVKRGRPSSGSTRERVTITLPADTLERVRQRAIAEASSLSGYIAANLEQSEREQTYWQYLEERFREQPITEEERQWIASLFDR